NPDYHWEYQHSKDGEMVYIPFEGTFESKGGRIQSPKIKLDKESGKSAFYNLKFHVKTGKHCYWWVDLFDAKSNPLPDINSAVYPIRKRMGYNEMIYVSKNAEYIQFAFQSSGGIEVTDFSAVRTSPDAAAKWCDEVLAELPPYFFEPDSGLNGTLPKTAEAFRTGKPWRIVMLGDSIQNDTYTSCFEALVLRDFPDARPEFFISVRGGTGCWYYHSPEHFKQYVTEEKPDLLLIGGSSNICKETPQNSMACIGEVIEMAKVFGCEVALLSPPKAEDWRPQPSALAAFFRSVLFLEEPIPVWNETMRYQRGLPGLLWSIYRDTAEKHGVPFFNMTVPTADYLARSGKPIGWFNRDSVHNNDRGKQILGRTLQKYLKISCTGN
ncbi:MAG: SGNH/GDSL hydrolase family protein, partial [Lentisphaeria bacterium]